MTGLRGTISMITVDHSELRTGSGRTIPSLTEGGKLMRQEGFGIRRKGDPPGLKTQRYGPLLR